MLIILITKSIQIEIITKNIREKLSKKYIKTLQTESRSNPGKIE